MWTKLHRFSGARILLVDDDVVTQRLIASALDKAGFKNVAIAGDGQQAIDAILIERASVAICGTLKLWCGTMNGLCVPHVMLQMDRQQGKALQLRGYLTIEFLIGIKEDMHS